MNGHEFDVQTSPPTAGGQATVTFDVGAKRAGHLPVDRDDDLERHAGLHHGSTVADVHALAGTH